jgi:hypothetical protein
MTGPESNANLAGNDLRGTDSLVDLVDGKGGASKLRGTGVGNGVAVVAVVLAKHLEAID